MKNPLPRKLNPFDLSGRTKDEAISDVIACYNSIISYLKEREKERSAEDPCNYKIVTHSYDQRGRCSKCGKDLFEEKEKCDDLVVTVPLLQCKHAHCRCMNLNGMCPNQHYSDCLKKHNSAVAEKEEHRDELRANLQKNRSDFGKGSGNDYWDSVINIIEEFYENQD